MATREDGGLKNACSMHHDTPTVPGNFYNPAYQVLLIPASVRGFA